jgi:putative addiction module component (TIGR02574 family)
VTTREIIEQIAALPVEERAAVADGILQTLNTPDPEIDSKWLAEAQRRLKEVQDGEIEPVTADEVRRRIQDRFGA